MREAVLVVAHGTVSSPDEIPEFLRAIRRGRPASAELVAETRQRYLAIGRSPLLDVTQQQARRLGERIGKPVFVGMRLWRPLVADVLAQIAAAGIERVTVVPLAPFSVGVYHDAALAAQRSQPRAAALELVPVAPWGSAPELVAAHVAQIRAARGFAEADTVVLSAHSLPLAVVRGGDRYPDEVRAAAAAIGRGLGREVTLAYQSRSAEGEWLGPDLRAVLEAEAARGRRRLVLAPLGFLAEQMETLYDLDIQARGWADSLGLELERVPTLGASPGLIEALAAVVERASVAS